MLVYQLVVYMVAERWNYHFGPTFLEPFFLVPEYEAYNKHMWLPAILGSLGQRIDFYFKFKGARGGLRSI